MKLMKHVRVRGLLLAGVCLMAVFAFGSTGSASANVLLFKTSTNPQFPFHLAGIGGKSKIETLTGGSIEAAALDALVLLLSTTLFDANLKFLTAKSLALGGAECNTPGSPAGTIVLNLLGHLGLTHPNDVPGVLLLIPTGFSFTCGTFVVDVRGSVIGLITTPKILTEATELGLKFEQAGGMQKHTQFLLGNTLLVNQVLQSNILTVSKEFEESGEEAEVTLKALTGILLLVDE